MIFNYIKNFVLFCLIALGLYSCKSYKNEPDQKIHNLKSNIIDEAIQANFNASDSIQIIANEKKTWILYVSETEETQLKPIKNTSFFVFDNINQEIIYQNKYSNAEIKWFNNEQLLLIRHFGTMQETETSNIKKYIINIKSEKVKEFKENNKSNI